MTECNNCFYGNLPFLTTSKSNTAQLPIAPFYPEALPEPTNFSGQSTSFNSRYLTIERVANIGSVNCRKLVVDVGNNQEGEIVFKNIPSYSGNDYQILLIDGNGKVSKSDQKLIQQQQQQQPQYNMPIQNMIPTPSMMSTPGM